MPMPPCSWMQPRVTTLADSDARALARDAAILRAAGSPAASIALAAAATTARTLFTDLRARDLVACS